MTIPRLTELIDGYGRRRIREARELASAVRVGFADVDIEEQFPDPDLEVEMESGETDGPRWKPGVGWQ